MEKTIEVKECKRIETLDATGQPNGWLLEIVSDRNDNHIQGQVYLTVAKPGYFKGYHMHALADYHVTCIKGKIRHIVYTGPEKKEVNMLGDSAFKSVVLPRGYPHALENIGKEDAYVIVYRYPAWEAIIKEQLDIKPEDIEQPETWEKIERFIQTFNDKTEK